MDAPKPLTRLERLEAARDVIWASIQAVSEDKRAPLLKEYRATLAEIDSLAPAEPEQKGTPLDELEKRRAARKPGAAGGGSAAK